MNMLAANVSGPRVRGFYGPSPAVCAVYRRIQRPKLKISTILVGIVRSPSGLVVPFQGEHVAQSDTTGGHSTPKTCCDGLAFALESMNLSSTLVWIITCLPKLHFSSVRQSGAQADSEQPPTIPAILAVHHSITIARLISLTIYNFTRGRTNWFSQDRDAKPDVCRAPERRQPNTPYDRGWDGLSDINLLRATSPTPALSTSFPRVDITRPSISSC
ncbi:hypothetical protein BDZ89DRAFT_1139267 [Hymenopellis radicata]|nr:hypothetical protein BDZ89DRAFT_1139267 [Hymenopellis radicata]